MDLSHLHLHWRACRRGKKEYKSYSLARAYRLEGKNRKEIVLKLGKLSDGEVEGWRTALRAAKNSNADAVVDLNSFVITSNHSYLDVAVILDAWDSWELSAVFNSVDDQKERSIPLSSLAAILTANRCIDPTSKSRVSSWFQQTTMPFLLDASPAEINSSRIFRELASIESCKDRISQHLCKKIHENSPEDMKSLFYDLSSTTFTGNRCLLVNWGHCKEGYENHIVLALIVNTKGLPLYWEVLEGGTADATTITWLLDRLKEKLPIVIPTMVFDRGMVSDDNLKLLETNGVKYITAMDKNQIEEIAKSDFSQFAKMADTDIDSQMDNFSDFIKLDNTTYCKEICVINDRRYVLCLNTQLLKDQRKARMEQIIKFESFVEEQNKELLRAKRDRNRATTLDKFNTHLRKAKLQDFVKVKLEEKYVPKPTKKMLKAMLSYQAKVSVDESQKIEAGKLDGFWLLVTNHSEQDGDKFIQDTRSVVQPYRDKVVIESSFRDIKSFIEISPVHVWKPEHVKAHYTICVLAHLIDRTLSLRLHENKGVQTKEIVSHERLYEELEGCRLNHIKLNSQQNCYRLTEPTSKQKELLERLKMKHLAGDAAQKRLGDRANAAVTSN
jgi:transposase